MTDLAAELVQAYALIRTQDDRIAGLLELLAKECAKTAVVRSPMSDRITLTGIELERLIRGDWLAASQ